MENINSERKHKLIISTVLGMLVIILALILSILLEFNLVQNLVLSWILTTAFSLFAFFMIDPKININPIHYIEKPVIEEVIKIVEKPIIKEIQIPIENKIIEVVEKPIFIERNTPKQIETPFLNLVNPIKKSSPKLKFIGSIKTKIYHKRTCKFSKMLKRKFKIQSNSKRMFKRKKFKACKECLKK